MNIETNKINFELIFRKIEIYDKINAEQFAKEFFQTLGYEVNFSKKVFKRSKENVGIPDLIANKDGESIYVEVKTNGDGLSIDQLNWFSRNKDKKIYVFFLEQIILKNKLKKILNKENKEKEEFKILANEVNQIKW